ncbi:MULTISPECIES: NUDIX hydrolase [Haloferax]|uniref:Phosphatase NudJ n=1 Tax=Haloferax massiliensis TaxID=1476858 RepID=A0A0D6JMU5_9EURY|nr:MULTISPECIES: NUDIX hydrolase [Haloferax]MDS0242497.1 NUDIX hydrolase [Haloferax sp. S2CR25]MDS0445618.1 NUDIX hydrolase [Haloferax sp. S2CR25-2]CQR49199.1 Phosphatase NudJ [Haloferax massiliensis]
MSQPPTLTFAAGGLLRRDDGRLCLVHRPRYDDWSLPKGKLEPGETLVETAVREVREETRCAVDCGRFAGRYEYRVPDDAGTPGGPKGVFVWHMRVADERPFEPDGEVDARRWVTPAEALERLSYETERALVRRLFEPNE